MTNVRKQTGGKNAEVFGMQIVEEKCNSVGYGECGKYSSMVSIKNSFFFNLFEILT